METVAQWEGRFHSPGVGYDADTGLTFDGHGLFCYLLPFSSFSFIFLRFFSILVCEPYIRN